MRLTSLHGPHSRRRGEMFQFLRDRKMWPPLRGPPTTFAVTREARVIVSGLFPLPGWDGSLERLDNSQLQLRGASVESKQLIFNPTGIYG